MVFVVLPWSGSEIILQTGRNLYPTVIHILLIVASPAGFHMVVFWAHSFSSSTQMIYHTH